MAVDGPEEHRSVGNDRVQQSLVRSIEPKALVAPAIAADKGMPWMPICPSAHLVEIFVEVRQIGEATFSEIDSPDDGVEMSIVEPGKNCSPLEVDHPGAGADPGMESLVRSGVSDPSRFQSQSFNQGLRPVGGVDAAPAKDQVGRSGFGKRKFPAIGCYLLVRVFHK
jgi:hypothetical protein